MNYTTAKQNIFAEATIPDGYFEKTARVDVSLVDGRVIYVTDHGCFGAGLPTVQDKSEALWLLNHHPSSRASHAIEVL